MPDGVQIAMIDVGRIEAFAFVVVAAVCCSRWVLKTGTECCERGVSLPAWMGLSA